jgi:hypothetical protein
MNKFFLFVTIFLFSTPTYAQRMSDSRVNTGQMQQWQFCMKVAQITHQPCRVVLNDLRKFMNSQQMVQITTPLTLIEADLYPVTIVIPREQNFHRRRHR